MARWIPTLKVCEMPGLLKCNDPVILDIGANTGKHSQRFFRHFKDPTVYAFEPDARAIKIWKKTVLHSKAKLFETAVGNKDGKITFHVSSGAKSEKLPQGWHQSGSIRTPKNHLTKWPWVKFEKKVTVPIIKLDTWLAKQKLDRIDFIWADVQGAEEDLIRGASKALSMTKYFFTEYSDEEEYTGQLNLKALMKLLPDFRIVKKYRMDVLLKRR